MISLMIAIAFVAAQGSGCALNRRPAAAPGPIAFQQPPTLPEIIQAVNSNSSRVQQLHVERRCGYRFPE